MASAVITIVIVDDHAIVREGLRLILEQERDLRVVGYASSGREALRLATELRPEVMVMDITMPEMDGLQVTEQLMQQAAPPRVIMLSMHSTREMVYRAFKAGASGYLLKESAGPELVKAIRQVSAGQRYVSTQIADLLIDLFTNPVPAAGEDVLAVLSLREREILRLLVEGKSASEIAAQLFISPKSVDTYRSRLMHKLDLHDLPSLVRFAIKHGIITIE